MRCPNCGTIVPDDKGVCPACHAVLAPAWQADHGDVTWCQSCGSAIPKGAQACPTCGMPSDAFVDEFDEQLSEPNPDIQDTSTLISAIPPGPSEQPDELQEIEGRSRRMRLFAFSIAVALVVVGGGALFITRPWDPNAYSTHAMVDADTSMEGFPGMTTHLSSQDHVEDAVWREYLDDAESFLTEFRVRMGVLSDEADLLYASLPGWQTTGDMSVVRDRALEAGRIRDELRETTRIATRLVLPVTSLDNERDTLLVLSSYLQEELEVIDKAWSAAAGEDDLESAGTAVRIALQRANDERDFTEWRNLFKNAYKGVE